ncbi:MAG TPA: hypothetical protein VEJ40_08620 [Pseudolabrys sp.]|nr:hypothetical protein [Pseudolabrys sp.]
MRLTRFAFAATCAVLATGLAAGPASAQQQPQQQKRVYSNRDSTVFVTRDENGQKRTKIIVQKRSYLDPGTEPLPSERNTLDYVQNPNQRADAVLNGTIHSSDRGRMFNSWDLPSLNSPFVPF